MEFEMVYSSEFKMEIVDAFFESNLSLRKFAAEYGMSKNTLHLWARDDVRYQVVKKQASWRRYPPEFKYRAVQMVIVEGLSSHKVAEIMGCGHGALVSGWVRTYRQKGVIGMEHPDKPIGKKKPDTPKAKLSDASSLEEYARELEAENERLAKENERLRFEADVAHAIVEVKSKKDGGLNVSLISNTEKTEVIDSLRPKYTLKSLLVYLEIAPSSYEYCQQIKSRPDKYEHERVLIIDEFLNNKGIYGYRRITASINKADGEQQISKRIVRRIMREEDLKGKQTRRRYNSYKGKVGKVAGNVLGRNFKAKGPLEKVVTDVTEFKVLRQKIYLAPLLDLYSGEVLSYSVGQHPTVEFILDMFNPEVREKLSSSNCTAHSDQGFQYQHISYQALLEQLGCTQSMSRRGNCLDNAPAESFFGHLKVEFFYDEEFESIEQFYKKLDEYIWWYNNTRIKMGLGGLSPVEYRESSTRLAA